MRSLRLSNNPLLTDKAFPSSLTTDVVQVAGDSEDEKPLPHRPTTWLDQLPPLILRHTADNLRVLDLTLCKITDDAIEGIVAHAPKIQTLMLTGCTLLTDRSLESICKLGDHLDVLMLARVSNITDKAVVRLARSCVNLRCIDIACESISWLFYSHSLTLICKVCRNLTDMSVFELAELRSLRRLSLVRVHKLTDIGIFALAEHAVALERLHLSYCDHLSLEAVHLLLRRLDGLRHLTATGIPSMRRKGVQRFSEPTPSVS